MTPDVVTGCSAGALVGACLCMDETRELADWLRGLSNTDIIRFMDVSLMASGGMANAGRLINYLRETFGDPQIEDLPIPFAAVATDLYSGREIWLREGSVWDAVRASIALPGILTPVNREQRWLVDGGLVNPVPVSICKALGADIIIGINLNADLVGQGKPQPRLEVIEEPIVESEEELSAFERLGQSIRTAANSLWSSGDRAEAPGTLNVMLNAINIMQDRITSSRLAGEPADVVLSPRLNEMGLMEFNRVDEALAEGRASVDRMLPALQHALEREGDFRLSEQVVQ